MLSDIAAALYYGKAIVSPLTESDFRKLSSILSRVDDFVSTADGRCALAAWYSEIELQKMRKVRRSA